MGTEFRQEVSLHIIPKVMDSARDVMVYFGEQSLQHSKHNAYI